MRIASALAGVLLVATIAPPATVQAQTVCLYLMLIDSHELAVHCGDTLDPAAQARYEAAVARLATFNVENSPRMKGHIDPGKWAADYQKRLHDRYATMDEAICKGADYPHWKLFQEQMTSPEGISKIEDAIKKQTGPDDRICL
jgi:hypothetical protein